jgi:hypothetical protein
VLLAAVCLAVRPYPTYAQWHVNGAPISVAANNQTFPQIISDGAGGAIITWGDARSSGSQLYEIYAQHLLASGAADPVWPTNGRALCPIGGNQDTPQIVSDGQGGAIVTWIDYRNGVDADIYAQRVLASGGVDPTWTATGTVLCNAAGDQRDPTIVSDGRGGAIISWWDGRIGPNDYDICAQHVLASGIVDPAWTANGTLLCDAAAHVSP